MTLPDVASVEFADLIAGGAGHVDLTGVVRTSDDSADGLAAVERRVLESLVR